MNYSDYPERKRIIAQALDATTFAEIEAATCALDQWLAEHPEDPSIEDAYEQLALMRNGLEQERTISGRVLKARPMV